VRGEPTLDLAEELRGTYEGVGDGFLLLDGSRTVVLARGLGTEPFRDARAVTTGMSGRPGLDTVEAQPGRQWRVACQPILSQGKVAAVIPVGHDLDELDEVLGRLG